MRKVNTFEWPTSCHDDYRHPYIKNNNEPVITINNNINGCCCNCDDENNPCSREGAGMMASEYVPFGGIGSEWSLVGTLTTTRRRGRRNPVLVTMDINWVPELFEAQGLTTTARAGVAPVAEFVVTQSIDDIEEELVRVLESAVAMNMPVMTHIEALDKQELIDALTVEYKFYARIDDAILNPMSEALLMAREYPEATEVEILE